MCSNFKILTMVLIVSALFGCSPSFAIPVDTELSLMVDLSSDVSASELNLVKQGFFNAFTDQGVIDNIQSGPLGKIAVNLVYWSGATQQKEAVGWNLISDALSAQSFGQAVLNVSRPFSGATAIGSAIDFAQQSMLNNAYEGTNKIMNISGDGRQTVGLNLAQARAAAELQGITLNGLVIGNQSLLEWYEGNVITGDGFALRVDSYTGFKDAIREKLLKEIPFSHTAAVPEPASLVLLAGGMTALIGFKKRQA